MRVDGSAPRRLTYGGCTRIGTTGPDRLVGGSGRDVLCGFEGDDLLRGGAGDDSLVAGPGADRLEGGAGDDVLLGEQGDDTLLAGPGVDTLRGGRGSDSAFADRRDTLRSIEDPHGGRIVVQRPLPTAEELERTTRAAAAASRASVVSLTVRIPTVYSLAVRADDPAAYLKHRVNRLLLPVRKAMRPIHFKTFHFEARDADGIYLGYTQAGNSSRWYVRPGLSNCANGIALDIEVIDNPDPPCPAR